MIQRRHLTTSRLYQLFSNFPRLAPFLTAWLHGDGYTQGVGEREREIYIYIRLLRNLDHIACRRDILLTETWSRSLRIMRPIYEDHSIEYSHDVSTNSIEFLSVTLKIPSALPGFQIFCSRLLPNLSTCQMSSYLFSIMATCGSIPNSSTNKYIQLPYYVSLSVPLGPTRRAHRTLKYQPIFSRTRSEIHVHNLTPLHVCKFTWWFSLLLDSPDD